MKYDNIHEGIFINRPNRFIANVLIDGKKEIAHVKNTGRCKELLKENTKIYLEYSNNKNRKTNYSLITVEKNNFLVNIDSQAPNKVWEEALQKGILKNHIQEEIIFLKREMTYKNSRIDFYLETKNKKIYMEIKGVTLEKDKVVMFPDAPTERGIKHINHLIDLKKQGFETFIVFVIKIENVKYFTPNLLDEDFTNTLKKAKKME